MTHASFVPSSFAGMEEIELAADLIAVPCSTQIVAKVVFTLGHVLFQSVGEGLNQIDGLAKVTDVI